MKLFGAVLTVAMLMAGCSGGGNQDEGAVRQGIIDHLSGRAGLDISSMDIEVNSVSFRGDEADATVSFQAKGSTDPAAGMQMQYTLERKGNRWVVKSKAGSGGMHGEGTENPHGGETPEGELPPGHPQVGEPGKPSTTG